MDPSIIDVWGYEKILWITRRRACRDGIKSKGDKIGMEYEA